MVAELLPLWVVLAFDELQVQKAWDGLREHEGISFCRGAERQLPWPGKRKKWLVSYSPYQGMAVNVQPLDAVLGGQILDIHNGLDRLGEFVCKTGLYILGIILIQL